MDSQKKDLTDEEISIMLKNVMIDYGNNEEFLSPKQVIY